MRELCYFRSFPSLSIRHKFQSVPLLTFLGIFFNKGWVALERIQLFTYFSRAKYWQNNLQFPIFGGGRIELVSSNQNFIDWRMRQSQTHLPLLKDKEKFSLELLGKNGLLSNDYLCIFGFLWNFAFLPQQNKEAFFTLLAQYQQVFKRLASAFRRRRRRPRLNRARFLNLPWSRSPRPAESRFEIKIIYRISLSFFLADLFAWSLHRLCWFR